MVQRESMDDLAAAFSNRDKPAKIERLALRHEAATDRLDHCLTKLLFWAGKVADARKTLRKINKALGVVDCDDVEPQEHEDGGTS